MKFKPMSFFPLDMPLGLMEQLARRNAAFKALHMLVANRQTNEQRRAILRAELLETLKKGK